MPLYEYLCTKCNHRFERIRKFSDPPLTTCPECQGAVEQLLSPPAVQFKGSGWYVTDYARKSAANRPGNGAKPANTESAPAEGAKSEPAPAASEKK